MYNVIINKKMSVAYPNLTQDDIETITAFFQYLDQDHDGFVTVNEIKEACAVDIDGDGVITEEEKMQCARVWLSEYLSLSDVNGDQKISLAEMLAMNNEYKGRAVVA